MNIEHNNPFDAYPEEYDLWYEQNQSAYLSELECIKKVLPSSGQGLEVGVGTGRFAAPLKVGWGIDPGSGMLLRAQKRGVQVVKGRGEILPYADAVFDYVLLVATLCFVNEPRKVLSETRRVLIERGRVIIGIIDKESFLGKMYQARKNQSKFYAPARFFSVPEILEMLTDDKWKDVEMWQTIYGPLGRIKEIQTPQEGAGEGGFVVISARKAE